MTGSSRRSDDFDALYLSSFDRLVMQLTSAAGSTEDAADVVQEAFLRAYVRWRHVGALDSPEAWVRHAALNLALSRLRRQLVWRRVSMRIPAQFEADLGDAVAAEQDLRRELI